MARAGKEYEFADSEYELEDIRSFYIARSFLRNACYTEQHPFLLSAGEIDRLKQRRLELTDKRISYLRAFIHGWTEARK